MKHLSIFGSMAVFAIILITPCKVLSQEITEKASESASLPLAVQIDVKPRVQAYLKVRTQQIAELALKYESVIEARFNKAASAGDLKMAKAFKEEKERIGSLVKLLAAEEKDPFVAVKRSDTLSDLPSGTLEALVGLRKVWTTEWQKIRIKLDGDLQQSLKALEIKFTKARDIDGAGKILAFRESLSSASPVAVAAPPNPIGTPLLAQVETKGEFGSFDNGKPIYSNRGYLWKGIPEEFSDWEVLIAPGLAGGGEFTFRFKVKTEGLVRIVIAEVDLKDVSRKQWKQIGVCDGTDGGDDKFYIMEQLLKVGNHKVETASFMTARLLRPKTKPEEKNILVGKTASFQHERNPDFMIRVVFKADGEATFIGLGNYEVPWSYESSKEPYDFIFWMSSRGKEAGHFAIEVDPDGKKGVITNVGTGYTAKAKIKRSRR